METLAYLHLALSYEIPVAIQLPGRRNSKLFEELGWKKFSTLGLIHLLSLAIALSVLGVANQALAALKLGSRGAQVRVLQQQLLRLGYFNGRPDGIFGSRTRDAVKQFQRAKGLRPDGVVGSRTQAALYDYDNGPVDTYERVVPPPLATPENNIPTESYYGSDYPYSRTYTSPSIQDYSSSGILQRSARGPRVKLLQEQLAEEGFDPGDIDGIFGRDTEQAVRRFQRARGLYVSGVAEQETLAALGLGKTAKEGYVVVVPIRDSVTLSKVRQCDNTAFSANPRLADSRLGDYVNAGEFADRSRAETYSRNLRACGLDARVVWGKFIK